MRPTAVLRILVSVIMPVLFCIGFTDAADLFQKAPLNPEFKMQDGKARLMPLQTTPDGRALGLIPDPLNRDVITGEKEPFQADGRIEILSLPASYDIRTLGKVTAVRDQGGCGSCWSFAAYGALESAYLTAETRDFSENHLKNLSGFDLGHCDGGNMTMSAAYLTRWTGPVNEADDPYNDISPVSPGGLQPAAHVQKIVYLPNKKDAADNDAIKQALMKYGAVYTTMYWNSAYYNPANYSYLYKGPASVGANHAVVIVGWDDNKAIQGAGVKGAFIIRNSWGESWGDNGYFFISYADTRIGKGNAAFVKAEEPNNYTRVYQYDPTGWTNSLGCGLDAASFANVFTAQVSEYLAAVGFYTPIAGSAYTIKVFTGVNGGPANGTLAAKFSGTRGPAGYDTIALPAFVPVTAGSRFSVVVNLTTPGYIYPIPIEDVFYGLNSSASANPGEGFISCSSIPWTDITSISWLTEASVALKAFTQTCNYTVTPSQTSFDNTGGEATIEIAANNGCPWQVSETLPWLSVVPGPSGKGAVTLTVSVAANTTLLPRSGALTVAGQTIIYQQAARPPVSSKLGVFKGGLWFLDANGNETLDTCGTDECLFFGQPGDKPVYGDWNGDGIVDIGVFRSGKWYLDYNGDGVLGACGSTPDTDRCYTLGTTGDLPVTGDFAGDGIYRIGVFRAGKWFIDMNMDGNGSFTSCQNDLCATFGAAGDKPVVGDWDGSGTAKIGVFRAGKFILDDGDMIYNGCKGTLNPALEAEQCASFGTATDLPIVGDWNGDGIADVGIYRSGKFILDNGDRVFNKAGDPVIPFGDANCKPITGSW